MERFKRKLFWAGLAAFITFTLAMIYMSAQQALRLGANEPQASMAQDIAKDLKEGKNPEKLVDGYIDMATNMAPFIIIYDQYGKVVEGNGYLGNSIPQVPIGVLAEAKNRNIHAVTWQPDDKVRIASVSVEGGNYYVLGGRSLFVVENQIRSLTKWIGAIWLASIIFLFLAYSAITRKPEPEKHKA